MRINQNISAVLANDQLLRNENSVAESVRKLSSGMKFNSAKDNPSGVAISYKMQAQINALTRASANTTDGISIVQTIDGAMGETTEIIQRINELCVQAANGLNSESDLEAIQMEIGSLKEEIDRIATDTEFNGKTLLDGSLDRRTYVTSAVIDKTTGTGKVTEQIESIYDEVDNVVVSDEVQAGDYTVHVKDTQKRAYYATTQTSNADATSQTEIKEDQEGIIEINGVEVKIEKGMTKDDVFAALRDAGEKVKVDVFAYNTDSLDLSAINSKHPDITKDTYDTQGFKKEDEYEKLGDHLVFLSEDSGSNAELKITCTNESLANLLGLNYKAPVKDDEGKDTYEPTIYSGSDADVELVKGNGSLFTEQATVKASGNRITITDRNGFEMNFEIQTALEDRIVEHTDESGTIVGADGKPLKYAEVDIKVTDMGTLQLQVGANEDQEIDVRVPKITTKTLYIDDLDVTKEDGGTEGIRQIDKALTIVSAARAKMGAYQNRLEYTQSSLNATIEDMTTAISRLSDVDMAEEMTTYTNANVLDQASISVLTQANDLPQQVLSLLQR